MTITENLSAQVDGANTSFTTTNAFISGTLVVSLNGVRQTTSFFTETSVTTFDTTQVPESDDKLQVQYETSFIVIASGIGPP